MIRDTLSVYDIKASNVVTVRLCSPNGMEMVLEGAVRYASGLLSVGDGLVEVEYEDPVDYEMQCAYLKGEYGIVMFMLLVREPRQVFSGVIMSIEKAARPWPPMSPSMTALSNIALKIKKIYALVKTHLSIVD